MRITQVVVLVLLVVTQGFALAADPPGVTVDVDRSARLKAAKMPVFAKPLQFDTPEADAVLAALAVFPPDSPWHVRVDSWPVAANSQVMIATIGAGKPLRYGCFG